MAAASSATVVGPMHSRVQAPGLEHVYIVPVDECGSTQLVLRLAETRNGQRKRVRYAADYTLQAWLNTLWEGAPRAQLPD